jgi:hypothetical protein
MSSPGPAVLVMVPSGNDSPLREALGTDRAGALAAALRAEAQRWAEATAPGRVHCGDGPLAQATAAVLAEHDGPLLVVWPVLARFRSEYAAGALGDLEGGSDLVIGPVIDGGLYLLGLTRPLGEVVSMPDEAWSGKDTISVVFEATAGSGLEVGMLRAERALRQPSDVRAALADPLTSDQIGRILRGLKQR